MNAPTALHKRYGMVEPMKRNILILIVLLGIGVVAAVILTRPPVSAPETTPTPTTEISEDAKIITLTSDGFSPSELTVTQGDTVTFVSTAGELFWPASNLHPSHTIYPEFDPQMPVSPTESWSFTFTKVGEWKFHDHLAPYFTGVITVTP